MEFSWTAETIRWFGQASDYTGYHHQLAEVIRPMVSGFSTMCDMGCGMGRVALELAGDFVSITCIDINPHVLNDLRSEIARRGIGNMEVLQQDCNDVNGGWDVMLLSFFGTRTLSAFRPMCRRLLVVVDQAEVDHLYPAKYKRHKRNTSVNVLEYLQRENIPHTATPLDLEFGQPFVTKEDAAAFITTYAHCPQPEIADYLDTRLQPITHNTYNWFLPHRKKICLFNIEGLLPFFWEKER